MSSPRTQNSRNRGLSEGGSTQRMSRDHIRDRCSSTGALQVEERRVSSRMSRSVERRPEPEFFYLGADDTLTRNNRASTSSSVQPTTQIVGVVSNSAASGSTIELRHSRGDFQRNKSLQLVSDSSACKAKENKRITDDEKPHTCRSSLNPSKNPVPRTSTLPSESTAQPSTQTSRPVSVSSMSPRVSSVQQTPSSSTSPVQPSSVHSSPVQPSSVHSSPVQPSSVQPSSVHSSPVQPSSFHSSSVHSSPVQSNRQHSSSNEGGRVLTSPPRTTVEVPPTRSPESRRHLSGSPDQRHSNNSQSNQHNSSTDSNEVFYNNVNIRVTNETRITETQSTSPVITSPELTELPPYRPEPSPTELTVLPDILQHTRPPTTQTRPPVSRRAPIPRQRTFSSSPEKICCDSASCTNAWRLLLKLRWVLVSVATLACCCLLAGIVLGALHVVGHNSVALAIMFAVLGGLLIVVVLIGWRCAPEGHEPCHMLFGIEEEESSRRRRRRRSRHTGTRHRPRGPMWHGGVIPAEFRNRERPPTYNISQQQRQGQTSSDRHETGARQQAAGDWSAPSSNPPSYRSRASTVRTGINITYFAGQSHDEYPNSQPPTYRSGANTGRARLHRQQSWTPEEAESSTATTSADQVHEMGWSRAGINQSNTLPSRATHDVTINMPA